MADLTKIRKNGIDYDIKDAVARREIEDLKKGAEPETEMVLSDNLFDKSTAVTGYILAPENGGPVTTVSDTGFYAYVPLKGAGVYRTVIRVSLWGDAYAKRVPILKEDGAFLEYAAGTLTYIGDDNKNAYLEFTVTQSMITSGAALYGFSGVTSSYYPYYIDNVMIVKDREYPSEYIPYGYIEVATDNGKKQDNVLCGKISVFLGDSICAATSVGKESEYYCYGWAGLIGEANHMNWTNYGKDGGTITELPEHACISQIADTAIAEHPSADYVIFEGGCNDADKMRESGLGEISTDYATFDTNTFSGALEALILKLVTAYPYAKIGYIIPQKMYTGNADYTAKTHIHRLYFDRAVEICQKWGIPVVDIWNCNPLNPKLSTHGIYYVEENGQHLTLAGYQRITPQIEAFMRSL